MIGYQLVSIAPIDSDGWAVSYLACDLSDGSTMLKIRDIMSRDVFTFSPSTSIDEAAWALAVRGISGAPVRDGMGRLLGVLSRTDLTDPERNPAGFGQGTVRDLMTPALLTLRAAEPVMKAVRLMVREEIHRVIVLDEHGEMVGILTSTDVLRAMVEGTAPEAAAFDDEGNREDTDAFVDLHEAQHSLH